MNKRSTQLGLMPATMVTYVDITKKVVQCSQSTPVFNANNKNPYSCMWCTFKVMPNKALGCPISRISHYKTDPENRPNKIERKPYMSEYVTHGVFCSFNCAKAFINEHNKDTKYRHSARLLALMYNDMLGNTFPPTATIHPAPHYLCLSSHGGNMSESQFQQSLNNVMCTASGMVAMFPATSIFE